MIRWHNILGTALGDYFIDTCYSVDVERELEIPQFLDILIIRQKEGKKLTDVLNGFENLLKYNVISYKSMRQPLDTWAIDELCSYYVLFRKMISPKDNLLPAEDFKLYGIATRFPEKLKKEETLEYKGPGVYNLTRGIHKIEIIVIGNMPREKRAALWQIFSTKTDMIEYGMSEYKWKREDLRKSVVNELTMKYQEEGIKMPYTQQDWFRDVARDHLLYLTPEERLHGLKPEERLHGLRPEDRLVGMGPEEIEKMKAYLNRIQM